jgi:hypothetical protein
MWHCLPMRHKKGKFRQNRATRKDTLSMRTKELSSLSGTTLKADELIFIRGTPSSCDTTRASLVEIAQKRRSLYYRDGKRFTYLSRLIVHRGD